MLFGSDILSAARGVNAFLASLVPLTLYLFLLTSDVEKRLAVLASLALGTTYAAFTFSVRALSEPLFLAWALLTLLALSVSVRRRSPTLVLLSAALIGALVMVRLIGIAALIPLVLVCIVVAEPRARAALVASASSLALFPAVIWVLQAPAGAPTRHIVGPGGGRSGLHELQLSFEELGHAVVVRPSFPSVLAMVVGGLTLLGVTALSVVVIRTHEPRATRLMPQRGDALAATMYRLAQHSWMPFSAAYLVLTALQRWWVGREVLLRYWMPFMVVVAAGLLCGLAKHRSVRTLVPVYACATVFLLVNVAYVVQSMTTLRERGVSSNEVRFQDSQAWDHVLDRDPKYILADRDAMVYLHLQVRREASVPIARVACDESTTRLVEWPPAPVSNSRSAVAVLAGDCSIGSLLDLLGSEWGHEFVFKDQHVGDVYELTVMMDHADKRR